MLGPRSLQGRLLVWVLGVVGLVWLGTAAWTWFDVRHELDELLDAHLAQAAALLVARQTPELDEEGHGVDAPTLHRYAPKVAFQVFHEGSLVLRSANAPLAPMVGGRGRHDTGFSTVQVEGWAWRVFATRGAERDTQVYVGERTDSRASILWAVLRSTLWPMALALPLLALAASWAVHRGLAPLRRLGRTLAERPANDLQPVSSDESPAEMKPMLEALNGLFERISVLLEGERRFTADAAHELRTPIAAIRAQAQVALAEGDEPLRRRALQHTLEGCDRATRLVDQLLTLSRLEAQDAVASQRVDLAAIARRALVELAPQAIAKQQTLELDAASPCHVIGDETLLTVLVRNLVDNALRYSPPSAVVRVRVSSMAGKVMLGVEDSGPGVSEADSARLGERFFRVPGSDESGSGLGWSIAQRIAAFHRATLRAQRSVTLGGLAVEMTLPTRAQG